MDQAQSPSQAPQPEQDDIQALRDRVRRLEDELASRKAQAHTQPESTPSPQAQQEQHAFVHDLVARMSGADRTALHNWATRLLQVRHSGDTMLNKATQTLNATVSNKAALPAIKLLASEAKRRAWDQQGTGGRVAVAAGMIVALMAGPAALLLATTGVAAGFPLWTVFGSGDSLLQAVITACAQQTNSAPGHTPITTVDPGEHAGEEPRSS